MTSQESHKRLQRPAQHRLLPGGGQLVTLRYRNKEFFRLTVGPLMATFVFDAMACRYFDRPHPLSDIFYERAPR